ncbi:molybdopterin-dependent oxidoreductase [Citreimonas salinaria]|uniref:Formate dehydrogenase major subunit n=1 Tax=Citreimonas salinaria TaxID=321339 RepID=A0A1H3KAI2_9RHOB|nr:molybdopterin-dependent oxidoreductase [Citreimonas salinaria]SDY49202.1 formate dehydrogenase major subunit [Citreimonas salinaria]
MLKRKTATRPTSRQATARAPARGQQSRRDFLKASGLAGISLAGITVQPRSVQAQFAPPDTPDMVHRKTICQFCSVGCSMWAEVENGVWVGQEPAFESPINQGTHCAKGAAMREIAIGERRLKYPMKKEGGEWVRISWDQAISEISEKLLDIRETYGPDSAYWLGSAKYSNEAAYLFRKFAAFWGTNNVDHQARICHSTTVAGVANTFGYGAMTNTFNDIRRSKSILIIGGNPAEAHPVSMLHVLNGKENGAPLIVVDPRFTRTAAHSDEYVRIRPGSDMGFIWGLVREIFENGWEDREYLAQRVFGIEEILPEVEKWTPEEVERVCGIAPDQTRRVARTLAENRPGTLVWCMGLTQHTIGSSMTRAASILQLVLGNVGKVGGGTNIFRGHDNVQGATDLGVVCDSLPAYYGLEEGAWRHWGRVWGTDYDYLLSRFTSKELMERSGMPLSRYMDGILEDPESLDQPHPVKAMTFWGHAANSITRGPDQIRALDTVDLLCVVDPHPTQVAIMTQKQDNVYLLPAGTTAEMHGSVTNSSRSVQWRDKVIEPLFEAKTDYEITYLLAKALGFADEMFKTIEVVDNVPVAESILREINRGTWTIGYTGQSPERLKRHMEHQDKFDSITLRGQIAPVEGEYYCLPWPSWGRPEDSHPGTPLLYDQSRPVAEGGLPFRARWGVEHEGATLLAEDSYTVGSEIKDGYPEITLGMIHALGWAEDLTARERLMIIAVGADRFRLELFDISEEEAQRAVDDLEASLLRNSGDGDSEDIEGSWMTGGESGSNESNSEPLGQRFPDYPENALTAIEAHLASNRSQESSGDQSLRSKIEGVNWKTDLSGGLQRVAIAHGLAPYGNGKARAVVWNFPDKVPLHREPLLTPRRDLLPEYATYEDRRLWRLPVLFRSIQEVNYADEFPMILTSGRLVEYEGGGDETRSNKWLAEFQQQMFVEINPVNAATFGVEDGDFVWVATPEGRIRVAAMVTTRVGPGTVFLPFHFAGFWMGENLTDRYPEGTAPYVVGEAVNTVQTYGYDVVTQMQETKCTLCRIERA